MESKKASGMRLLQFLNIARNRTRAEAPGTSRLVDPRAMIGAIIATGPATPRAVVLSRVLAGLDGEPTEFRDTDLFALDAEAIGLVDTLVCDWLAGR